MRTKKSFALAKRYAETHWTIGDLEETLKGYYGEDFKATDGQLAAIMQQIEGRLLDDITSHGNDMMLSMAIRAIEETKATSRER